MGTVPSSQGESNVLGRVGARGVPACGEGPSGVRFRAARLRCRRRGGRREAAGLLQGIIFVLSSMSCTCSCSRCVRSCFYGLIGITVTSQVVVQQLNFVERSFPPVSLYESEGSTVSSGMWERNFLLLL